MGFSSCEYFQANRRLLPENEALKGDSTRLAVINEFIEDEEDEPFPYYQKAKVLKEIGEVEEAYKAIQQAIALDSIQPAYHFLCAELLYGQKNYVRAKKYCQKAELLGEQVLEVTYLSANLAAKTEDLIPLVTKIAELESVDPLYSELRYLNGIRYYLGKDTVKAINLLSKFVKTQNDEHAFKVLGELYQAKGELDKGLEIDSIALSYYPKNTDLLLRKANHFLVLDENIKARQVFLEVLKDNPNNSDARFSLVEIALKLNDPEDGLRQLKKLNDPLRNQSKAKSLEGDCYFMKRDYKNARTAYLEVLKQNPQADHAQKQISRINWRIKNANSNISTENNSNLAAPI